ncbi:MAG: DUF1385 domain-containing protein [Anaerolineales bacterium]|nr:DUF1385 domain-containing protein [Anaerolineales bacterium]
MMRGARHMAVAIRNPAGEIVIHSEPLNAKIYGGLISKLPFLRGIIMLWDALVLGMRALLFSADVALEEEEVEFKGPIAWGSVAFSFIIGIGVFLLGPLLLVGLVDRYIASSLVSNILEGLIRLAFFLIYVYAIGFIPDIRRVFAYHGAEHETINAYESGAPLEPDAIKAYSTAHPRCGTGFLLIFAVIAILVFSLLGRPPLVLRILSRLVLIPVIAGLTYELIKFSAAHRDNPLIRGVILAPSLALQRLTTREPDESMLEVAIAALQHLLDIEDEGVKGPASGVAG